MGPKLDYLTNYGFLLNKKNPESEGASILSASAPSNSMEHVGFVTTVSPTTSLTGRQDPHLSLKKPVTQFTWWWTSRRTFLRFRKAPCGRGVARDGQGGTLDRLVSAALLRLRVSPVACVRG